jgi:hypothetical protein
VDGEFRQGHWQGGAGSCSWGYGLELMCA